MFNTNSTYKSYQDDDSIVSIQRIAVVQSIHRISYSLCHNKIMAVYIIAYRPSRFQASTHRSGIGIGDGAEGTSPPPKKKLGKIFFGQLSCNIWGFFRQYVKFGNFINFSGKYHVKFEHFLNFIYIFSAKTSCPPQIWLSAYAYEIRQLLTITKQSAARNNCRFYCRLIIYQKYFKLLWYTVFQKGSHQTLGSNFVKSQPILKIVSLTDSAGNFKIFNVTAERLVASFLEWNTVGDFTFWLSPWLSLLVEPKSRLSRRWAKNWSRIFRLD